jgi:hypothetical protein
MQVWDIIAPADLTVFSRQVPDELGNSLSEVLPDRTVNDVRARQARHTKRNVTAKFRAWNAETPIGFRPDAITITEVQFPPIGQKIPLTEADRLQLALLGQGGTPGSPALAAIIEQIYDDVEQDVLAIRNRVEMARGDVLVDGKFTLTAENGLTLEADFGLPGTHVATAATLWTAGGATPLSDEQAWVLTTQTDAGSQVVQAVTSLAVVQALLRNQEYRSAFWGGNAAQTPNLSRTQLDQVRADYGLPPIKVYDRQLEVDGVNTRVIPANRFVLRTANLGETQWGITPDALELVSTGAMVNSDAPGIIAAAYTEVDPLTKWTKATGACLPVLADPNGLFVATVTA